MDGSNLVQVFGGGTVAGIIVGVGILIYRICANHSSSCMVGDNLRLSLRHIDQKSSTPSAAAGKVEVVSADSESKTDAKPHIEIKTLETASEV